MHRLIAIREQLQVAQATLDEAIALTKAKVEPYETDLIEARLKSKKIFSKHIPFNAISVPLY